MNLSVPSKSHGAEFLIINSFNRNAVDRKRFNKTLDGCGIRKSFDHINPQVQPNPSIIDFNLHDFDNRPHDKNNSFSKKGSKPSKK